MTNYNVIVTLYYNGKNGKNINRTCQLSSFALSSCFTNEIDKAAELAPPNPEMRGCRNYGLLPNSSFKSRSDTS